MKSLLPLTCWLLATAPVAFAAASLDQTIEKAAMASYNYRTVLEDHVRVKSAGGVVTLTGTVRDLEEQLLAADTVGNLPGVIGVKNLLAIKSTLTERSDPWMARKIRSRLLVRAQIRASSTLVTVQEGIVTLDGTADTAAQKERTGLCAAEIAGVKYVKNNIIVRAAPAVGGPEAESIDDASITSQVRQALQGHNSTRMLATTVTTTGGVVRITGFAAVSAAKLLVSQLAQDVRGTKSVTNEMTVGS